MLRAEVNKSRAAFIEKYVLATFIVEEARNHTIKDAYFHTVHPIAPVHGDYSHLWECQMTSFFSDQWEKYSKSR
jgi:hypothetical protein